MLPSFASDTVTIERAPLVESRGTLVPDWESAQPHEAAGCSFQPAQGSSAWNDPRQASTVRAVLYLPPNSDIREGDRVRYGDASYSVDGAPLPWKSPTGRVSHVVASLVDWRG